MAEQRLLIVKLGSLGDLVFTLPAVSALRRAFPQARIDWIVQRRWAALLDRNPDINQLILLERSAWAGLLAAVRGIRAAGYTCALDFQGLYKSAVLARLSGAPALIGFDREFAREPAASLLYTRTVAPGKVHMVEQNFALAEAIGARSAERQFPLRIPPEAAARVEGELRTRGLEEFYVLSPGGGWRSKCWPPERFGQLHRALSEQFGWRGVLSFGPDERDLAEEVAGAAGEPAPALLGLDISGLMALLQRAKFVVAADTGPLHLAGALGTPVIGLYGPTAPWRNGPYSPADVVVRNARPEETTLRRGKDYSWAMLSITVEQVVEAVARRMGKL
jgi:heptosyltransferase-1